MRNELPAAAGTDADCAAARRDARVAVRGACEQHSLTDLPQTGARYHVGDVDLGTWPFAVLLRELGDDVEPARRGSPFERLRECAFEGIWTGSVGAIRRVFHRR